MKTLKILSRPQGNAEEYGRWSVNPYLGCSNQCSYCYLSSGPWRDKLGQPVPTLKEHIVNEEHAYHLAMAEIIENREQIIKDGGLFMTFTSDPCIEQTRELMFHIIEECIGHAATPKDRIIPVTLLTKNADFCGYDIDIIRTKKEAHRLQPWLTHIAMYHTDILRERLAIGWTLTGHDELEPNASANKDRIRAMHYLSKGGYRTWASVEPVIDFDSSYEMIKQAVVAGCEHFKIGLMTKHTKVCRKGFSFGGQDFPPYDPAKCLAFIQDVMALTKDYATVYWKQSFRDFIGSTKKHRLFSDDELHDIFDQYPHAVGKDWSMFNY